MTTSLNKHRRISFHAIKNQEEANPAYQQGMQLIKEGNWEYGFYLHELRSLPHLQYVQGVKSDFDKMPVWIPGMDCKGVNIVVWCEAGWGDMIQFSRFIPLLKEAGVRQVKLGFPRQLVTLLRRLPNHDGFYDFGEKFPNAVRLKVMSLPYFLMEHGVIPAVPVEKMYGSDGIFKNSAIVKPQREKPLVGLCWTTTNKSWNMAAKQIPEDIAKSFVKRHSNDVDFVSLQIDNDFMPKYLETDKWSDTADKVQALDAVITVDSAMAHCAGSVGVPTAVIIGEDKLSCWRWYPKKDTTHWYDSVRTIWYNAYSDFDTGLELAYSRLFGKEEVTKKSNEIKGVKKNATATTRNQRASKRP